MPSQHHLRRRPTSCLLAAVLVCSALPASAGNWPARDPDVVRGAVPSWTPAPVDTVVLVGPPGSGAPARGDFENGWGGWTTHDVSGTGGDAVGDFAGLWSFLEDGDPCMSNYSTQVVFIDDGSVVPGVGPSNCLTWCYGPGGYVVNTTGGLAGPGGHLHGVVRSPVLAWPGGGRGGLLLTWNLYLHESLAADAPGVFVSWGVRSADTDGSAGGGVQDIAAEEFRDRGLLLYGDAAYTRLESDLSDLLVAGRDEVQVQLGVAELGWIWGWNGNGATPAPYFDDVSVKAFSRAGPVLVARAVDLAQDAFPERDDLATGDPAGLHVRFDMAASIAPVGGQRNDPGDSIVVRAVPGRDGASLAGPPTMHYVIAANPAFDPYRTTPTDGVVDGVAVADGAWAFDLPDTGTLFPGDVLHYYVRAGDDVGGDVRHALLPADLDGFGDFSHPQAYDPLFTVRALPTVTDPADPVGSTPGLLFWNDGDLARGSGAEWYRALDDLHLVAGLDYDVYTTNAPGCGAGNGVGGRTAGPALEGYEDIWYSAGDHGVFTLGHGGGTGDAGDDLGALSHWLAGGDRDLLLAGDGLASDLAANGGVAGADFLASVMGVEVVDASVRMLISNQTSPLVQPVAGNPVFADSLRWVVYGGCANINRFDAVVPATGATRLAEFLDPIGSAGVYDYAAATLRESGASNRVLSLPCDLRFVYSDPAQGLPSSGRTLLLGQVAAWFDVAREWTPPLPPPPGPFRILSEDFFLERVTIVLQAPVPVDVDLKIHDIRGRLVYDFGRIRVDNSTGVIWPGEDTAGRRVAAGVYFVAGRSQTDWQTRRVVVVH